MCLRTVRSSLLRSVSKSETGLDFRPHRMHLSVSDGSRLAPRQNVRRQVYKLNQPTRMTEAPARVVGRCLTVVATAKMIARPNATANAAKMKRGAITCSLLDCLNCINLPRSIWFRPLRGEIGAVQIVLAPFVNFHDGSPHRCDERQKQKCLDDHCFDP
jgi:hypothetical protein